VGSIALWGVRQRGIDVIAIVVAIAAVALAVAICGGLRLEPLARRGQLVSQLRFAATVQDLRTVVILRRQLRAETLRARPWGPDPRTSSRPTVTGRPAPAVPGGRRPAPAIIWRRGGRSLRRLPAARVFRIAVLAALGGVGASLSVSSSPLSALLLLAAAFLVGMESLEPLSQEIDRPDRTDGLPVDRGWLHVHHLLASAVLLVVAGLVGAVAATITDPEHAAAAFALAVPVAFLGSTGAIVTTVLDAPAPISVASTTITGAPRGQESPFAIPEFAGASMAIRTIAPVVISATAVLPVLLMRVDPSPSTIVRSTIASAIFIAAVLWWVRRRDRLAIRIRAFFAEGRASA
jgi:hypothetical protein